MQTTLKNLNRILKQDFQTLLQLLNKTGNEIHTAKQGRVLYDLHTSLFDCILYNFIFFIFYFLSLMARVITVRYGYVHKGV